MVVVDVVKAVFVVIESRLRLRVAAVVRAPEDPAVDGRCLRMLSTVAFCPYLRRSAADTKGVISLFSPIGIIALGNIGVSTPARSLGLGAPRPPRQVGLALSGTVRLGVACGYVRVAAGPAFAFV